MWGAGYMDEEEDGPSEAALQKLVGLAGRRVPSLPERDYPNLSAAEFRRFLRAANESRPGHKARWPCRAAAGKRALLALALLGLTVLTLVLAAGREGEGILPATEISRLKREVCHAAMGFTRQRRESLESVCEAPP